MAKQPWQMTKKEYSYEQEIPETDPERLSDRYWTFRMEILDEAIPDEKITRTNLERIKREKGKASVRENVYNNIYFHIIAGAQSKSDVKEQMLIEYGQMNRSFQHTDIVKEALFDDKPVPQKVLKDYPDLQKKAKTMAKEFWQMTSDEYAIDSGYKKSQGSRVRENWRGQHEGIVRVAVQQGKPVPQKVLKDYPAIHRKVKQQKQVKRLEERGGAMPKQHFKPKPKPKTKRKPKPLPQDAVNPQVIKFNSDEATCYGKRIKTGGFRVYCRLRKE